MGINLTVDKFIETYIDYIDREEWEVIYQQAEILLEYPYDLTSKLLAANIDPLPKLTTIPYSYAPLELDTAILNPECIKIRGQAFNSCENLKTINLPEGLKYIEEDAFANSGLIKLTLPKSLKALGPGAFRNCRSLNKITYNGTIDEINQVKIWEEVFENIPCAYIECVDGNIELRDIDE